MSHRRSVQELVNPLRRLSLLSGNTAQPTKYKPDLDHVPEHKVDEMHEQSDIISLLPKEVVLKIFSLLSFQDLIRVQLTCRLWRNLCQDTSIWRTRYQTLNTLFPDIYAHKPSCAVDANLLPWHDRYCQSITLANWRMGTVQQLHQINENHSNSRLLSVKLRESTLVTLTEDNIVRIYEYSTGGFEYRSQWTFKDTTATSNIVECVDVLSDINILVVAQRGSRCMFYDINKGSKHDPIQILKGGSHVWFIPDSISVNQDYFALSGRNPSAVFVWNWRKGVRLCHRAFDNQPHGVFLSGENLLTFNVDGVAHTFHIFDQTKEPVTYYLNPCSIPCTAYDNSLNLILVPHASRRIHHYRWNSRSDGKDPHSIKTDPSLDDYSLDSVLPTSPPAVSHRRRLSNTFTHFLRLKSPSIHDPSAMPPLPQKSKTTQLRKSSFEFYKSVRLRRHSSYNDYGYSCQMKTDQYIKQVNYRIQQGEIKPKMSMPLPNLDDRPLLFRSIRTSVLQSAAKEIVNVALHKERLATVNRHGDISIYAFNGSTAARVSMPSSPREKWIENGSEHEREDDDLSDGYNFIRSRLAMGQMGIVYGDKSGCLWWLDFSCRPEA